MTMHAMLSVPPPAPRAGLDAIIAQGSEAGGHRGTFSATPRTADIGTMALVPQIVDDLIEIEPMMAIGTRAM
jgi:NAD(P)H-dependent flavin oxidoreductase YrpB (nitropropane dioxygenase family)